MSNQDTIAAYAARIDAAATTVESATTANTAAIDQLRSEVAAGQVETPLDVSGLEAATARAEAAANAATVPPAAPAA